MNKQTPSVDEKAKKTVLELIDVNHSYQIGPETLHILNGVNLSLKQGEIMGLVGPSGCGKSSLLHIAGLLEKARSGQVMINQTECMGLPDQEKTRIRRYEIGFIYQFHHLLPEFSACENIILPQLIAGVSKKQAVNRAERLLALLNLKDRMTHRPGQLSGGERQRVAIARALANQPDLILADEPTGNLDPETSNHVLECLINLAQEEKTGLIIATHNYSHISHMQCVMTLKSGQLEPYNFS